MKVLLDECLPQDFRKLLPDFDPHTVAWAGFSGLKNGKLLSAAEQAGYEVMITLDSGIPHQHDWRKRSISLVILHAESNRLRHLSQLIPAIVALLPRIMPGQILHVPTQEA